MCIAITMETHRLKNVISVLPERIKTVVYDACISNKDICELRLRNNQPPILITPTKKYFIGKDSIHNSLDEAIFITKEELEECFNKLCHYSVYSYKESINSGFITLDGCRVGVCGNAVVKEKQIYSVKNISSLNFRFAKQVDTSAEEVLKTVYSNFFDSLIIIGSPSSGKTTLLRDICRLISSGYNNNYLKCAVIDEREEIAAAKDGVNSFDVGINTDVLSAYPKKDGVIIALRTMSPEVIFLDEIGSVDEAHSVCEGLNSGVKFVCTVHADSFEEAAKREQCRKLLESGFFGWAVCLGNNAELGKIKEIKSL